MANLETLELTINANAQSATQGLSSLIGKLSELTKKVNEAFGSMSQLTGEIKRLGGTGNAINIPKVRTGRSAGASASRAASGSKSATQEIFPGRDAYGNTLSYGATVWNENGERSQVVSEEALKNVLNGGKAFKLLSQEIKPLAENTQMVTDYIKLSGKATAETAQKQNTLVNSFKNVGERLKDVVPKFKMLHKVMKMATTMLLRMAIRAFFKGAIEGYKNYYEYAKATGNALATDVEKINGAWKQIKNQMGASLASVFSAAIPVINAIANAAITAFNYVSQLIALLTGKSSWSKANEISGSLDDVGKSAGGAGGKVKELLADFDELNVIASESGGGGGGGGATQDFESMFTEMTEFEEHLKEFADFIKKNAENIKDIAIEAGAAFLAWKVSQAFAGTLSTIATLVAAGIVMDITWRMTAMFDNQFIETGEEGWLVADAITNAVGSTLAGTLVGQVLGTGAGLVTAGFTLLISGAISYGIATANEESDNADALKTIGLVKGAIGDLLIGAGFYVSTGSMAAAIGMAALGAPLFFAAATFVATITSAKKAQEIAEEAFENAGEGGISVKDIYDALNEKFKQAAEPYLITLEIFQSKQAVMQQLNEAVETINNLNSVVTSGQTLTQEQANSFKNAWDTVFEAFTNLNDKDWQEIFEGFNAALQSENDELKKIAEEQRLLALQMKENLSELEAQLVQEMQELTDKIIQGTATPEEIEQYRKRMEALTNASGDAISDLKKMMEGASLIDFSDYENGVAAATEFIKNISDNYASTVASIDEGLAAQLDAIESQKQRIQSYVDAGILDADTAKQWTDNLDEFAETFKQAAQDKKDSLAEDMKEAFAMVLNTAKEGLKDYINEDGGIDWEGATSYVDNVINPIIQALKDSGADYHDIVAQVFDMSDDLLDAFDIDSASREELLRAIVGELNGIIDEAGGEIDLSTLPESIFDPLNWDIEANRPDMAKKLADYLGFDVAVKSLMHQYELDIGDIINIYGWDTLSDLEQGYLMDCLYEAFGTEEAIAKIKESVPSISATDILNITDWSDFDDGQILDLVNGLIDAFGADEAINAAKQAGIDIDNALAEGLKSKDKTVSDAAKTLQDKIQKEFDKKPKLADPTAPTTWGQKVKDKATKLLSSVKTTLGKVVTMANPKTSSKYGKSVKVDASGLFKDVKLRLTKKITTADPSVPARFGKTVIGEASKTHNFMVEEIDDPLQSSDVTTPIEFGKSVLSSAKTLMDNLKKTLQEKVYVEVGIKSDGSYVRITQKPVGSNEIRVGGETITPYALGGMVKHGQIFIAGEAGPELVGTIGNQSAVANQGQIIEGIRKGVSDAQSEQNALLRQQNALLQSILEKDNSVRLTASSALGRTVRQSLNMYSAVTGG